MNNYQEENENIEVIDNSDNIKNLLDAISLRNYVNKINENKTLTKEEHITVEEEIEPGENIAENIEASTPKDIDDVTVNPEKDDTPKEITPKETTSKETNETLIYCPNCGEANYALNRKCQKCNTTLISYMTDYGNEIKSYDEILSKNSIKKIEKAKITQEFYDYILKTITDKCKKIDFTDDINIYDKITHITRKFVDVQFEYQPNINMYGIYSYDLIHINTNQSFSQQCASLIRYLSQEIHLEIMEAIFMYIFDVKNNAYVRNFINTCRTININEEIIHTYYPIQVESHFIPEKYHSYDRINEIMEYVENNKIMEYEQFQANLIIGNTFAQDIIKILEKIIDEDMKNELANEYELDKEVPVPGQPLNIEETVKFSSIIKAIKSNMIETIKTANENEAVRKKLFDLHERFEGKGNSI